MLIRLKKTAISNRNIIFFILFSLGITLSFQTDSDILINEDSQNEIFNNIKVQGYTCDSFKNGVSEKYFVDKKGWPVVSAQDSIDIMNYAKANEHIKIPGMEHEFYRFYYLIPRIRNIINTKLYDSNLNKKDSSRVCGLDKYSINDLVNSDAVVTGEVVAKRYIRDSTKCYYFTTEFVIKIDEVLHSYFKLNKNELVLLKSSIGYVGGCNPQKANDKQTTDHIREFNDGDKWIFFLKHNDYYSKFLRIDKNKYQDKYCPYAFLMYDGNQLYNYNDTTLMNNIREFCKTKF